MEISTDYRIKIHLNSFRNEPIAIFYSANPFMNIQVGEEIDPISWSNNSNIKENFSIMEKNEQSYTNTSDIPKGRALEVVKIRHLISDHSRKNIQTKSINVKIINNS